MKDIFKKFEEKFISLHNVKSWGNQECDCDKGAPCCTDYIKSFLQKEITDLLMSMPLESSTVNPENNGRVFSDKIDVFALGRNQAIQEIKAWRDKIIK